MGFNINPSALRTIGQRVDMRLQLLGLALAQDKTAAAHEPSLSLPFLREVHSQSLSRVTSGVVNQRYSNLYGDTILHLLAPYAQPRALEQLKANSSDTLHGGLCNRGEQTPLMIAALSGNNEGYRFLRDNLLKLLFTNDMRVTALDRRDKLGLSQLDYAVMGGATEIVLELLEFGLRPTLVTRPVPTTLELAVRLHGSAHPLTETIRQAEAAQLEAGTTLRKLRQKPSAQP